MELLKIILICYYVLDRDFKIFLGKKMWIMYI